MRGSAAAVLIAAALSGCTWTYPQPTQSIRVELRDATRAKVLAGDCRLMNDRGTWRLTVPGVVDVTPSTAALAVDCRSPGQPEGYARVFSGPGPALGDIDRRGSPRVHLDPVLYPNVRYPARIVVVAGTTTQQDGNTRLDGERAR